ncbi:hypothetical protein IEQ34_013869 [Dendrobium chrysotoxum]|uniref:RRM domain-containing protein n=1 Tax=Dendrobium chrysotoxum TaxID=161865 RepID=A0AAV7GSP3_DENCH|nr:hypothetical protein IEQ34_013869 [Dendrobium chrysotoxum]
MIVKQVLKTCAIDLRSGWMFSTVGFWLAVPLLGSCSATGCSVPGLVVLFLGVCWVPGLAVLFLGVCWVPGCSVFGAGCWEAGLLGSWVGRALFFGFCPCFDWVNGRLFGFHFFPIYRVVCYCFRMSVWVSRRRPAYAFVEFDDRRDALEAIEELDADDGRRIMEVFDFESSVLGFPLLALAGPSGALEQWSSLDLFFSRPLGSRNFSSF